MSRERELAEAVREMLSRAAWNDYAESRLKVTALLSEILDAPPAQPSATAEDMRFWASNFLSPAERNRAIRWADEFESIANERDGLRSTVQEQRQVFAVKLEAAERRIANQKVVVRQMHDEREAAEKRALDAVRRLQSREPAAEEMDLTDDDRKALDSLGDDFIDRLIVEAMREKPQIPGVPFGDQFAATSCNVCPIGEINEAWRMALGGIDGDRL